MTSSPFYWHGLTVIPAWISNYTHYKVLDEITCPFPNFNGVTVEVWEWTSNSIPHFTGIARHRGFASLTHSKSQSRIVVTSAAAHGRIVKTVKKVTTYMVGTVKRQNTSSSERSWRKIAETRQSLFRKSAWSGYAHKMCAVDSNTKRLYSN